MAMVPKKYQGGQVLDGPFEPLFDVDAASGKMKREKVSRFKEALKSATD